MKTMLLNFRKSFVYAMAIFAGVVLATTSCNPFGKYLGDGDGDGDGDGYVTWSTDIQESANQIVFTVDYNSGFSGNTIYNPSYTMVYTFTFRNDICIGAISETTFESQVYADAYYSGEGTKSGRTITIDLTDDFADMTKTEVRQIIQVMESQYNNNNNNN